jgi:exopolysaccharide biosynthesis protein
MEQNYLLGLPLKAFAQLCKDEGAVTAYNLDGGYSSALLFKGRRLNEQERVSFRNVADIVYFASSWSGVTRSK